MVDLDKCSSAGSGTEGRFVGSDEFWVYFWKWCWMSNCVHGFDPKLQVWGWPLQNKISFQYIFVVKIKQYTFLVRTLYLQKPLGSWKTFDIITKYKDLHENIVLKVDIYIILRKPLNQRLIPSPRSIILFCTSKQQTNLHILKYIWLNFLFYQKILYFQRTLAKRVK